MHRGSFVVGFFFSKDLDKIILISKRRPEWQAGFCNGPGGRIHEESDESIRDAMVRELQEETGLFVPGSHWKLFHRLVTDHNTTVFFLTARCTADDQFRAATTVTDEEVVVVPMSNFPGDTPIVPNLAYLVPQALYVHRSGKRLYSQSSEEA